MHRRRVDVEAGRRPLRARHIPLVIRVPPSPTLRRAEHHGVRPEAALHVGVRQVARGGQAARDVHVQLPLPRRVPLPEVFQRVCAEREEPREEAREVLEPVRGVDDQSRGVGERVVVCLDVGDVEQVPGGRDVEQVVDRASDGAQV